MMRATGKGRRAVVCAAAGLCALGGTAAVAGNTNNILITGYWPPSNEMMRGWSTNPTQNPSGWIGRNWEGRGYDVYAYFPEFPGGTGTNPKGNGDFEVDYQDTASDWARIIAEVRPVAIVTTSRANTTRGWELEPAATRHRASTAETNPPGRTISLYTSDYLTPTRPTNVPITAEPVGTIRNNTLPMQAIVDAVRAEMTAAQIDPFIQVYDPQDPNGFDFGGAFLSGYIAYLGMWHQELNAGAEAEFRCVAAGHVHVGMGTVVSNARQAMEITLRTVATHVDGLVTVCPADWNDDAAVSVQDIFDFLAGYFASEGDVNADGTTGVQDIFDYLAAYFEGCG
jgi:hypothetical protein